MVYGDRQLHGCSSSDLQAADGRHLHKNRPHGLRKSRHRGGMRLSYGLLNPKDNSGYESNSRTMNLLRRTMVRLIAIKEENCIPDHLTNWRVGCCNSRNVRMIYSIECNVENREKNRDIDWGFSWKLSCKENTLFRDTQCNNLIVWAMSIVAVWDVVPHTINFMEAFLH